MATANLTDAILVSGSRDDIKTGTALFSVSGGEIISALPDVQVFSTQSSSNDFIQVGDTTVFDGTTYTVTGIGLIEATFTYVDPNTGLEDTHRDTQTLWIEVTDGTNTFMMLSVTDFTGLPQISQVTTDAGFTTFLGEGINYDDDSAGGRGILGYNDASGDTSIICFANGTQIMTNRGTIAVENLRIGDMVLTRNDGYQPIRWLGFRKLRKNELEANPKLRPVRIKAHAFGENLPGNDLVVSPQHRILVTSDLASEKFGSSDVLIPAVKLTDMEGIDQIDTDFVAYFHILLDDHHVIYSNGVPSETLHTGPQAIRSLSHTAQAELREIFPDLFELSGQRATSAPVVERRRDIRSLNIRKMQNIHGAQAEHAVNY